MQIYSVASSVHETGTCLLAYPVLDIFSVDILAGLDIRAHAGHEALHCQGCQVDLHKCGLDLCCELCGRPFHEASIFCGLELVANIRSD